MLNSNLSTSFNTTITNRLNSLYMYRNYLYNGIVNIPINMPDNTAHNPFLIIFNNGLVTFVIHNNSLTVGDSNYINRITLDASDSDNPILGIDIGEWYSMFMIIGCYNFIKRTT